MALYCRQLQLPRFTLLSTNIRSQRKWNNFSSCISSNKVKVKMSNNTGVKINQSINYPWKNDHQILSNYRYDRSCQTNTPRCFTEDSTTKPLTIWKDVKQIRFSPKPAVILGFAGLVPFISAPIYLMISQVFIAEVAFAQMAYGGAILSFLGGVRWGFVIQKERLLDWMNMIYSVTPPLIAWIGLLMPLPFAILTMTGGLAASVYFDLTVYGYPPWFKGLRFTLSFFAIISLWTTFVCKYHLRSKESNVNQPNAGYN